MSDEATNVLRQALAATQSTDADQRKQGAMFLCVVMYSKGVPGFSRAQSFTNRRRCCCCLLSATSSNQCRSPHAGVIFIMVWYCQQVCLICAVAVCFTYQIEKRWTCPLFSPRPPSLTPSQQRKSSSTFVCYAYRASWSSSTSSPEI